MKKSNLQFSDPRIININFMVNDEVTSSSEMPINIEVESKLNPYENESIVNLTLIVGEIDEKYNRPITSIYFNGTISADFKWDEKVNNPEKMLKISGGTVLLSYIRPVLANLTMQSGIKPLNLPFVNFTEE